MKGGILIRFHRWRGFTLFNAEPDLFSHVFKLGFVTVYVCRVCLLAAYRKLRSTIAEAVNMTEGR
jgi:hypothetical protein